MGEPAFSSPMGALSLSVSLSLALFACVVSPLLSSVVLGLTTLSLRSLPRFPALLTFASSTSLGILPVPSPDFLAPHWTPHFVAPLPHRPFGAFSSNLGDGTVFRVDFNEKK